MKFEVRDKVKIREDLIVGHDYGYYRYTQGMCKYAGKYAKILGIGEGYYILNIDGECFNWTDEMLKPVTKENVILQFKVGDKVRVSKYLHTGSEYTNEYSDVTYCNSVMVSYCGKLTTITGIIPDNGCYRLDCDDGYYAWSIGMLEPVTEEVTTPTSKVTIDMNKFNEEDRKTIQKIVNKQNNPFDIPTHEHTYYYITTCGTIISRTWMNEDVDEELYLLGNYFLTIKEAKFEVEKRKIIRKLEILAKKSGGVDWNNYGKEKYYIKYSHNKGKLDCVSAYSMEGIGGGYFPTEESVYNAISIIGEDNIKKYIFGVEE